MSEFFETDPYAAMAQAVKTSIEELLVPFNAAPDAAQLLQETTTDNFFREFLVHADKFTGQCCQDLSKIFRQSSLLTEVRGTPTLELAKQIRQAAFENLDKILFDYIKILGQTDYNLGEVSRNFADSSVVAETMKGAAVGRVAGGFGNAGKTLAIMGAIVAAGNEANKQLALLQHQQALVEQAHNLAFIKITEYLETVQALPENLLDYGFAKCFGGQIDFSRQALAVEQVRESIRDKLVQALEFTHELQQIEQIEAEKIQQANALAAQQASEKAENITNKSVGGCLIIFGFVIQFGLLMEMTHNYPSVNGSGFIVALVIGMGAIVMGNRMRKKKKSH